MEDPVKTWKRQIIGRLWQSPVSVWRQLSRLVNVPDVFGLLPEEAPEPERAENAYGNRPQTFPMVRK